MTGVSNNNTHAATAPMTPIGVMRQRQVQQQQMMAKAREEAGMFPRPLVGEAPKQGEKRTVGGFFKSLGRSAVNFAVGGTVGFAKDLVKGAFFDENGNFSITKTLTSVAIGAGVLAAMATPAGWIVGLGLASYGLATGLPKFINNGKDVASNYLNGNWEAAEEASYKLGSSTTQVGLSAYGVSAALKGVTAFNASQNAAGIKTVNNVKGAADNLRTVNATNQQAIDALAKIKKIRSDALASGLKPGQLGGDAAYQAAMKQAIAEYKAIPEVIAASDKLKAASQSVQIPRAKTLTDLKNMSDVDKAARAKTISELKAAVDADKAAYIAQNGTILQKTGQTGRELFRVQNYKNFVGDKGIGQYYRGPSLLPKRTPGTQTQSQATQTADDGAQTQNGVAQAVGNVTRNARNQGQAIYKHSRQVGPGALRATGQGLRDAGRNAGRFAYDSNGSGNVITNVRWNNIAASQVPVILKDPTEKTLNPFDPSNLGFDPSAVPVTPLHGPAAHGAGAPGHGAHSRTARITPSTRHLAGRVQPAAASGGGGH